MQNDDYLFSLNLLHVHRCYYTSFPSGLFYSHPLDHQPTIQAQFCKHRDLALHFVWPWLVQFRRSTWMSSFSLISPSIGSKYFHLSSFFCVAMSFVSTGSWFCVYVAGRFSHIFLDLVLELQTCRPSTACNWKVFSSFRVLIDIEVALPPIFNYFIRFSLTKVPWLQLSSIVKVFTSLLELFYFTRLCIMYERWTYFLLAPVTKFLDCNNLF